MEYLLEERLNNGIVELTLNRPKQLNALCKELLDELEERYTSYQEDESVKVIMLKGNDKAFCAGADITQLQPLDKNTGLEFAKRGQSIFRTIETIGKPTVSCINGYTFGGGCELAMATTLRIAGPNAVFGQPEVKLAVIPGFGGTQRLSRLVGKGKAMDLCLTGRSIDGETAYSWGLASQYYSEQEAFDDACKKTAETLASLSRNAMNLVMNAVNEGFDLTLDQSCELEAELFGLACDSNDKEVGVTAFLNKEKATFS